MIPEDRLAYIARPFKEPFTPIMRTLSDILDSIEMEVNAPWSFVGGIARDLYLGRTYNDFDIVSTEPFRVMTILEKMGLYETEPEVPGMRPQDFFTDPYHTSEKHPIHIFHTDSAFGYAPSQFDFTINQIALKSNGQFYATAQAWQDLDKGRIRRVQHIVTTTLLMRAIRFSHRFSFHIEESFEQEIKKRIEENPLDTAYFIRQANKMIEDNVEEASLLQLKKWGVKEVQGFATLEAAIAKYSDPETEKFVEQTRDYYRDALAREVPMQQPTGTLTDDDTLPF